MNYADLFRVTLPETALEIAALVVLVVDLGFLRKSALKVRVTVAALLGVAGCGAALWALQLQGDGWFIFVDSFGSALLVTGNYIRVAQTGILVLTALTLLLLIDSDFTRHVGEFVAVMLMAAVGGLLIAGAGFAGHFCRPGVTQSGTLHYDGFCQEFRKKRGSCDEVLPIWWNVGGVSAVWF